MPCRSNVALRIRVILSARSPSAMPASAMRADTNASTGFSPAGAGTAGEPTGWNAQWSRWCSGNGTGSATRAARPGMGAATARITSARQSDAARPVRCTPSPLEFAARTRMVTISTRGQYIVKGFFFRAKAGRGGWPGGPREAAARIVGPAFGRANPGAGRPQPVSWADDSLGAGCLARGGVLGPGCPGGRRGVQRPLGYPACSGGTAIALCGSRSMERVRIRSTGAWSEADPAGSSTPSTKRASKTASSVSIWSGGRAGTATGSSARKSPPPSTATVCTALQFASAVRCCGSGSVHRCCGKRTTDPGRNPIPCPCTTARASTAGTRCGPGGEGDWYSDNGILKNRKGADVLVSDDEFWNFRLEAEFLIHPGMNGGIGLRGRYEIQLLDDHGRPPSDHGNAALYGRIAPSVNASKPAGEWQTLDVRLVGREVYGCPERGQDHQPGRGRGVHRHGD